MNTLKTSTILAAASVLLFAAASANARGAANFEKVVHSTNGNVVVDSQGDCVVTKWVGPVNECNVVSLTKELRTVYFEFNSSALTSASKAKLNSLSAALRSNKVKAVSIVGFADEIGTNSYNQRLSEKRANNVASYLRAKGIKVQGKSEVRGLGATASVSDCADKKGKEQRACLWRDRRVEVEVVE